ncbi:unnamed protein product [Schistosoma margrebowiei]|uniref:Uncharacterized protein n=1 Tax=Schistosoma margrebowiei TaxID=48269 RepID=A0A3P7ZQ69_9TREM|nr:unnamed protein product [Schistosoma margrebowiei]
MFLVKHLQQEPSQIEFLDLHQQMFYQVSMFGRQP